MRIPLESIRYRGGAATRMGIGFRRNIKWTGLCANWPDQPAGKGPLVVMATLVYRDLPEQRTRELLPSLTYSHNRDRTDVESWAEAEAKADLGLNIKYGLTSSVTLDATLNPDFSQVESDAFQVEVNQRYPIFYEEMRPFFSEGANMFKMPLAAAYNLPARINMISHVHTRRIIDPLWGVKLSGTTGKLTFGTLTAADEAPGRTLSEGETNPFQGEKALFTINRATYNFGGDNYAGLILADREFGDGRNLVVGGDASYRRGNHLLSAYALQTITRASSGTAESSGAGAALGYNYADRRVELMAVGEHFDKGFQMETAFYKRTGITMGHLMGALKLLSGGGKNSCITLIRPKFEVSGGRDHIQGGNEVFAVAALEIDFIKSGILTASYSRGREPWAGRFFNVGEMKIDGSIQLFKQVSLKGSLAWADAVYYDLEHPFTGELRAQTVGVTLQPSSNLQETISYTHQDFSGEDGGGHSYSVHILNTQSIYQFTEQFFLRAIVRFDSYEKQVLTDFLASYTLVPGTAVYAGYGSLIEQRDWRDGRWIPGAGDYMTTRRSLFFKTSYLWRF
jgi:hypothetical protein